VSQSHSFRESHSTFQGKVKPAADLKSPFTNNCLGTTSFKFVFTLPQ
jgi:hypothetical protein